MLRAGSVAVLLVVLVVTPVLSGCLAGPTDPAGTDVPDLDAPGSNEPGSDTSGSAPAPAFAQQDQFDRAEYTIAVSPNGSVRWTLTYRRALENETQVRNFRAYAENFNQNETDLFREFRANARATTNATGDRVGRDMQARAFQKEAEVRTIVGSEGVVRMSFVWTNFARVDGDQVLIGDVFQGGISILPNQVLRVTWGEELSYVSADPPPDDFTPGRDDPDSVTWRGGTDGRTFDDRHPQVQLTTGNPADVTTTTDGGGGDGTDGPNDSPTDGGLPGWFLGLVVILGLVFAAGVFVAYRTGALNDYTGGDGAQAGAGGRGGGGSGGGAAATAAPAIPDEELMSDEDRVIDMLEQNGGRMKQVNIVEETGWSKSKVSMLLSDMEDDGQISKLRVGRENIISKAGSEPEGARSPFDDDS